MTHATTIPKAMVLPITAARPIIELLAALWEGDEVGSSVGSFIGSDEGDWNGGLDEQILGPHEAPSEQKLPSEAESFLSHLQRFWSNTGAA